MTTQGIAVFAKVALALCAMSLAIIAIELANLPHAARMADRVELFVSELPRIYLAGDPTAINVGVVAGGAVFLSTSILFANSHIHVAWSRVAAVSAIGGCALDTIIIAGSRTGLIATFLAVLLAMSITGLQSLRQKAAILMALAIFVALPFSAQFLSNDRINIISTERINLLLGRNAADLSNAERELLQEDTCEVYGDSLSTRAQYLVNAVSLFREHPLAGIGPGNFGLRYCGRPKTNFVSPHNIVAHVFVELGSFGGLAFCGIVLSAAYMALRRAQSIQPVAVTMMGFFGVISLFSGDLLRSYEFYAALGILAAAGRPTSPAHLVLPSKVIPLAG